MNRNRKILLAVAAALVAVVVAISGWAIFQIVTWPDIAVLAKANPKSTAFIDRYQERPLQSARSLRSLRSLRSPRSPKTQFAWTWVAYDRISGEAKRAVLVAEDIEFFSHHGFSNSEMRTAIREAVEEGELPRGASTITQQLAKNLWLSPSRNPARKLKEALLTRGLERHLSKRRILEIYLNVVELGPGIYGVEAAARRYFGVSALDLDATQAAQLAAILPKPSTWRPTSSSRVYQNRVRRIALRSAQSTWLDREL